MKIKLISVLAFLHKGVQVSSYLLHIEIPELGSRAVEFLEFILTTPSFYFLSPVSHLEWVVKTWRELHLNFSNHDNRKRILKNKNEAADIHLFQDNMPSISKIDNIFATLLTKNSTLFVLLSANRTSQ